MTTHEKYVQLIETARDVVTWRNHFIAAKGQVNQRISRDGYNSAIKRLEKIIEKYDRELDDKSNGPRAS